MDSKELRGLYEAYSEVYAPVEEGLKPLPKEKMARQAQRAQGMENRAAASGDEKETNRQMQRRIAMQMPSSRRTVLDKKKMGEELDIFNVVLEFLQTEGYAETLEEAEWLMANLIDDEAIDIICELTGGKGHPGYKAGSKDHGPMQSGHPADSEKRKDKGGTMSQRHGYHLGDIDDDDDDEDGLETIVKQQSRDSRERVRKSLRNKVKAARKVLSKEEYVDEAVTSEKGKAKAAEMIAKRSTPSGRAKAGKGASVAAIKHISRANVDNLGGTPPNPKIAKNPVKSRSYGGTGNKAARRAGLTPTREKPNAWKEEFELWVDALVEEGYDLSGYTWDEMYEFYLDEASRADDMTRANIARYAGKKGISFEPGPNWDPSANRGRGAHLNPKQKEKQRRKALRQEEFVDEAQEARNNPEKYEREQSKKTAPVRGERTPMPPRGDKRREDFEKWYAANVR